MRFALIAVALAACTEKPPIAVALDPARGVVLPSPAGDSLLNVCSRPLPVGLRSSWQPDTATVARIERGLGGLLLARLEASSARTGVKPNDYARQYAGFYQNSHRVVYINGVLWNTIQHDSLNWRSAAIITCDGGAASFGALYDVDRQAFTAFAFNGAA